MEPINKDFEALGLGDEADSMQPSLGPVFRSTSNLDVLHAHHGVAMNTEVYRSLRVSDSSPAVLGLAVADRGGLAHCSDAVAFEDAEEPSPFAAQKKMQPPRVVVETETLRVAAPLRRKLASYVPASVHALTSLPSGSDMITRVEAALQTAGVDVGVWNAHSSSIPCTIVRHCDAYRFDVYVLELEEGCKSLAAATHILEVQRISSGGSASAWGSVVGSFMDQLQSSCFGGYFVDRAARIANAARAAVRTIPASPAGNGLSLRRQSSTASLTPETLEAELAHARPLERAPESDPGALDAEYAVLVAGACGVTPADYELRAEMAQLLARLSRSAEGAQRLAAVGAVDAVLRALQALVLGEAMDDTTRALCTALGNMCEHVPAEDACVAYDIAAHTTMHVLIAGDLGDHRQLELLREAARALSLLSGALRGQAELREQIRRTASACAAASKDARLSAHATAILQRVGRA